MPMRVACITLALIASALPSAVPAQDVPPTRQSANPTRIAYGPAPEQFGDLRVPPGAGPFPLAILVHGGCFVAEFARAEDLGELADSLRNVGIATWNVEYRRINSPGGGWPETFRDVGRAADHVRMLARDFPLDTARTIAVGHSAGGLLSLWLGARSGIPANAELHVREPLSLTAAVALGADGDLPPIAPVLANLCRVPVVEQLLGTDSTTRRQRAEQANPADMPRSVVPQLLISGEKDRFETPALRDAYVARAAAKGERIRMISHPDAGHFDVVNPKSSAWPTVRDALASLVRDLRVPGMPDRRLNDGIR